jgi:hypothetical protein
MLKKTGEKITIWERNFQLALYSSLLLLAIIVYEYQFSDVRFENFVLFKGFLYYYYYYLVFIT